MHVFDYRFLGTSVPAELAGAANIIHDLRSRNDLRLREDPTLAAQLRDAAIVESARGSSAIEGVVTTRARLEQILQQGAEPATHGEREILGYRNALQEIYGPEFSADLTEDYVCHLHALVLQATSAQAGTYKTTDNWIQERDAEGHISVRFVPVPARETPEAIGQLVMAYHEASQDSRIDPISLVACVVVDFLCIHPFTDGNGRVSRLLTTMLLGRSGFNIGRFVSLEGMVDQHKVGYYDALRASSEGWHENQSDYTPFITYLLQILYACYKQLDERYVEGRMVQVPKAERVEALLMDAYAPVSKADLCKRLPEVSAKTVERVLARMVKQGKIEKIGSYRDARYRRL